MTRKEFLGAYNIGHRDGKAGDYLPNDYDDIFHIEQEPKTDTLDKIREEISAISIIGQVDDHTMFVRSSEQIKQVVLDIIDKYRRNDNAKKDFTDRFRDAFRSFHR